MANRKIGCKSLKYLLSDDCIKKCDNVTIYNAISIARLFYNDIIKAITEKEKGSGKT